MADLPPDVPTATPAWPELEMRIPRPWNEVIAAIVFLPTFVCVVVCIVAFFVVLAAVNLVFAWRWPISFGVWLWTVIASCLWLLLAGGFVATAVAELREQGVRRSLVKCLGMFARKQFIDRMARESQPVEIGVGYELFGRRFYYVRVDVSRIESVSWYYSQTAGRAASEGRDVSDWSVWRVVMGFDRDDRSRKASRRPQRDCDSIFIGPERRKQETEAFGLAVIAFLRAAGAALTERGESTRGQAQDSDAADS